MGFFKKIFKPIKKIAGKIGKVIKSVAKSPLFLAAALIGAAVLTGGFGLLGAGGATAGGTAAGATAGATAGAGAAAGAGATTAAVTAAAPTASFLSTPLGMAAKQAVISGTKWGVVGGFTSKATGGKFADGFKTGFIGGAVTGGVSGWNQAQALQAGQAANAGKIAGSASSGLPNPLQGASKSQMIQTGAQSGKAKTLLGGLGTPSGSGAGSWMSRNLGKTGEWLSKTQPGDVVPAGLLGASAYLSADADRRQAERDRKREEDSFNVGEGDIFMNTNPNYPARPLGGMTGLKGYA